jgi:quercetin dioxygenase-like cupin family protein
MEVIMRFDIDYRTALLSACLLLPAGAVCAQAAAPLDASGLKRTLVYKGPVAAADHEAVLAKIEVAAGGHVGRHTHRGDEVTYVVDGGGEIMIEGQPPLKLKAGDGFSVPAGKVHEFRNNGKVPVHLIAVYVVEKGKPLATAAK